MCDPISLGLMAVGTAASIYGQHRVESAQKKDIAAAGQKYQEERARQQGFTTENEASVGKTLDTYSKPSQDAASANAIASRQNAYTAPLQAKQFVADMPADFDPNNIIAGRNAYTGAHQQSKSIAEALAKGKLDAYGDVKSASAIAANDNANRIGMVNAIARNSAAAANQQQQVLPTKLTADQNAGATWAGIGDTLKAAGMIYGMDPQGITGKLFGTSAAPISQFATLPSYTTPIGMINPGILNATTPRIYSAGLFG